MPAIYLVSGLVFARAAYSRAARFQRQSGQLPWGGSPMVWGFVGLMFGLLGYCCLAIAEKNTNKQLKANTALAAPAYVQSNRYPRSAEPVGQWAPPTQWSAPVPPAPGPPRPNVGGSDFLPGRR